MIKFFRHIRKSLIEQNKMGKYLKYAIGEILLVVIGILIALQINNWNEKQKDRKKERTFLLEIKSNLNQDIESINNVVTFNATKSQLIDNMLQIFPDSLSNQDRMAIIYQNLQGFPNYEMFSPKTTAFKNITSAENINLISSTQIRNLLIEYYEREYEKAQERVWIVNRRILDQHFPKFVSNAVLNYPNSLPKLEALDFHKDPYLYSDLYSLREVVNNQTELMNDIEARNQELITAINNYIETNF